MLLNQWIVFATLLLSLGLFIWARVRYDFVALIALFTLILTGVIDAQEAFYGFGHPAVITVAAVLVMGTGLEQSGLIDLLGKWVMKSGKHLLIQLSALCLLVAFASAFMNNVGALAIMMPVALHMARKSGHPPSYILMPIAFASLLGGMCTLIGTPPNIIISEFRQEEKGDPFGMFSFAPVGVLIAIAGLLFIIFIGWRLLPKRAVKKSEEDHFDIDDYITEVIVAKSSELIDKRIDQIKEVSDADLQVLAIIRNKKHLHAPESKERIQEGDIIIIETDADELKSFINDAKVKLVADKKFRKDAEGAEDIHIMEAVVMADALIVGSNAAKLRMRTRYGINLLAVARRDRKIHRRLDKFIFKAGDVLLFQGRAHLLSDTITSIGCLPLAERQLKIGYQKRIPLALGIFIAAILSVMMAWLPVQAAFLLAALVMILTGVIPIKEVYKSIDWPVIVLLGAMIPVGAALESTGGAELIAQVVLEFSVFFPPWMVLAFLLVITMFLSDVINNAATVVLMAPIAISIANGLGHSIDPYLMAVAIGGSCAFLTPIGHQSNTIVMSPGGYKFGDYWRMGLPLEIIIVLLAVPLLLWIWPL